MSSTAVKFDASSPAAKKLVDDCFSKLKQIWNPDLKDTSVAEYAVACVAKGRNKEKTLANLQPVFGSDAAEEVLGWLLATVKSRRVELTTAAPASKPAPAPAATKNKPAPAAAAAPEPAQLPDDVEALLQSEDAGGNDRVPEAHAEPEVRAVQETGGELKTVTATESKPEAQTMAQPGPDAEPGASDKSHHRRHNRDDKESDKRDNGHRSESGSRRQRAAIQWADPRGGSEHAGSKEKAAQLEADLAARRARFGAGEERSRHRSRSRSRSPLRCEGRDDDRGARRSTDARRAHSKERQESGSPTAAHQTARPRLRSAVTRSDSGSEAVQEEKPTAPAAPKRLFGGVIKDIKQGAAEAAPRQRILARLGDAQKSAAPTPAGRPLSVFERLSGVRKRGAEPSDDGDGDDGSPQKMGKAEQGGAVVPSPSKAPRGGLAGLGPGATAASALRQLVGTTAAKTSQAQGRLGTQSSTLGREGSSGPQPTQQAEVAAGTLAQPEKPGRGSVVLSAPAAAPPGAVAGAGGVQSAAGRGVGPGRGSAVGGRAGMAAGRGRGLGPGRGAGRGAGASAPLPAPSQPAVERAEGAAPAVPVVSMKPADEMAKLKEELKRKEMELSLMKGGMTVAQAEAAAKAAFDKARQRQDADRRSVVVHNVHVQANEQVLAAHFSPCGTINRVTILRNSYGPAGIAYIEFSSTGEACTALALAGSLLLGRPVAVSLKPPQPLAVQPPVVHRPARPVSGPTKLAEAGAKKLSDAAPLRGKMTWRRPSSAPVANGAAPATDTADATDAFEVSHDES